MSTHANGTQQTYDEIWAGMEAGCSRLMALVTSGPGAHGAVPDGAETAGRTGRRATEGTRRSRRPPRRPDLDHTPLPDCLIA